MFNFRYLFALFLTLFLIFNSHAVNYISCLDYPNNQNCIYPEKYSDVLSDEDWSRLINDNLLDVDYNLRLRLINDDLLGDDD